MIPQGLIDWYVSVVTGIVGLLPQLPGAASVAMTNVASAASNIGPYISKLGILVPFDVVTNCLTVWGVLMLWWVGIMILRVVIRLFTK